MYCPISVVQRLVPEDSVRPETLTLIVMIRRKGFVGIFVLKFDCNKDRILSETKLNVRGKGEIFRSLLEDSGRKQYVRERLTLKNVGWAEKKGLDTQVFPSVNDE